MASSEKKKRLALDEILAGGTDICFVAMDFSRKFDPVYEEVLEKVIVDCGMRPVRGDVVLSAAGNVVKEIVSIIQASRVVIVDITGLNPNVLIEVGIACALKRTVVLVTQDDEIPFNIQARRVIRYDMSESGKLQLAQDLTATLKSVVYPSESSLREMLNHSQGQPTYLVYGRVSDDHINTVFPRVETRYRSRLEETSTETSGIWDIALAFQKISWSLGREPAKLMSTDGTRAQKSLVERGNVFVFGGPGANPFFQLVVDSLSARYENALSIRPEVLADGSKRYRIYKGARIFPNNQDELLDRCIDVGMILRAPNPFRPGATIWLAAGIRTFGTEAAIKALVTPSLINRIRLKSPLEDSQNGLWAVVKARFDDQHQRLVEATIHESGQLIPRTRAS